MLSGNGFLKRDSHNQIQLPFQIVQTEEESIARVLIFISKTWTKKLLWDQKSTFSTNNVSIKEMNLRICFFGKERSYKSVDDISPWDQIINYPTEFLNNLAPTGTALCNLLLKLGAPILLLCNLDSSKSCISTRLNIKKVWCPMSWKQ